MSSTQRSHKLLASKQADGKTLKITGPVVVHAAAQPEAGKPAGPGKFEAAPAYSGGLLPGYTADLDHPVVIDLAGLSEVRNLKANLDHQPKQRVGHITEVVNDRKTLTVRGVFSAATPHRDEIVLSAADGFTWETSIETALDRIVPLAAGRTATVNGQTITGPAYIARKSRLIGLGFTGGGADPKNKLTIAASAATKGKEMDFATWLAENGFDAETISDSQRKILKASYDATRESGRGNPAGGNPGNSDAESILDGEDILGGRRLEAQRRNEIKVLAHRYFDQCPADGEQIESLSRQAVSEGWTANELELRLLRASRQPAQPRFASRGERIEGKVYEAAILQAAGFPEKELMQSYGERTLQAVDDNGLRNVKLQTVILRAAAANGFVCRPGDGIHDGNLADVIEYAFPRKSMLRASGAFSTVDLPSILGNVANKEISSGFEMEDQEWREVSQVKPVNNFYQRTVHSLLDDLEYQDLTPTGEIQHGKASEKTYTRQAKTQAILLSLSREDIINDDIGAFDDIRMRVGRGSGRNLNRRFWTKFLSGIGSSFWSTAKGNKVEHANSTLLIDGVGLQMLLTAFYKLTENGKRIGGRATVLLVPPELQFVADRFYQSLNLTGTGSEVPDANIHANKYKPVVAHQLSDPNYAGYSSTHWWLFRSPSIAPPMVVSALGGRVEPTVESAAADFNRLGVQFRGHSDVGCDLAEDMAGVMSKGAA